MEALKCSVCGGELMAGDSFCPNCGSPVTVIATSQEVPVVEEAAQAVEETAAPVVEEAAQAVEETAAPIVEEAAQAVEETAAPVVEEATQAVQETAAPVQETYSQETTVLNNVPQQVYTDYSQNTYTEVYDEPAAKESKIFGLIGMICGIASILCCVCGPILAIPGVILSIVGMVKKEKKTFPIVGIITSALGFIIGIIVIIVLAIGIDEWM